MNENHRSEDTAGHFWRGANTQAGEDDVAGHIPYRLDPQAGEDDAEGHAHYVDPQAGEEDVAGHVHSGAIRPDVYGDAGPVSCYPL